MAACSSGARPARGRDFYVRSMTTRNIETLRASIRALQDRATASVLLDVADSAWSWGNNPLPSPVTKATGFRPSATPVISAEAPSQKWTDITGKPDLFPPSPHLHPWTDIAGPPDTAIRWPTWDEVTGKPTVFPPSPHTHFKVDITDFAHTHVKADITDFTHTHVAGDISGLSGLYLPLAGGTMNNDAQVYLYDSPNDNWTDSTLLSAGLTYFIRTANDNSYSYNMYLHGQEIVIDATTSGSAYSRSTRMNIWGFEDSYVSTTDGEYGNLSYYGLNFRQKKSAGSELETARIHAGYFGIEHGVASDGVNISTMMRSITADVSNGAQIAVMSGVNTSWLESSRLVLNADVSVVGGRRTELDRYRLNITNDADSKYAYLEAHHFYMTNNRGTFDVSVEDGSVGINLATTVSAAYASFNIASVGNSTTRDSLSVYSTRIGTPSADFLLSSQSTCFVGQDFDIRNNKGLLIGGSSAISSARVGSFTGFSSTGGGTITGGKLTLAPAAAGYASMRFVVGADPASPVTGDIWANSYQLSLQGLGYRSARGASDTVGDGSYIHLTDLATNETKGWALQLGANNTLDFWNYSSGWGRPVRMWPSGDIQTSGTISAFAATTQGATATVTQSITLPMGGIYEVSVAGFCNDGGAYGAIHQVYHMSTSGSGYPYSAFNPATELISNQVQNWTGPAPTITVATYAAGVVTFTAANTGSKGLYITVRKMGNTLNF